MAICRQVEAALGELGENHAILGARHDLYARARELKSGALVWRHSKLGAHRCGDGQSQLGREVALTYIDKEPLAARRTYLETHRVKTTLTLEPPAPLGTV